MFHEYYFLIGYCFYEFGSPFFVDPAWVPYMDFYGNKIAYKNHHNHANLTVEPFFFKQLNLLYFRVIKRERKTQKLKSHVHVDALHSRPRCTTV